MKLEKGIEKFIKDLGKDIKRMEKEMDNTTRKEEYNKIKSDRQILKDVKDDLEKIMNDSLV